MKYHCFTFNTKTIVDWNHSVNDHPIKGCYHADTGLYMHLIPKNGSSFISGNALSLGWQEVTTLNFLTFKKGLIILRDPMLRWVSGIVEFFHTAGLLNNDFEKEWPTYKKLLMHNPIQDGHTSPQEEFLYKMDIEKFDFIFLTPIINVGEKVQHWLTTGNYENSFHKYNKENETRKFPLKLEMTELIKESLSTDLEFNEKIKSHFRTSYELIDWVNKRQKWVL
jgi:hypothetical protein